MKTMLTDGIWRRPGYLAGAIIFVLLAAPMAQGRHIYVATNATPGGDYDSWAIAFTNLQDAFEYAEEGDTLHLAGHVFEGEPLGTAHPSNTVFLLQTVSNLTIRGGYEAAAGSGANPGTNNPAQWPTVLTRSAGDGRILYLSGLSNVVFEGLTIQGGYMESGATGAGIRFDGCSEITLADCRIHDNLIRAATSYGGGLYLADSSVVLSNSLVSDNVLDRGALNANAYGGGAYVDGDSVLTVRNSRFEGNQAKGEDKNNARYGYGGGVYVAAGGALEARETVFVNNQAVNTHASLIRSSGGAVYNAGAMDLVNVLIAGNLSRFGHSDGVFLAGGMARLVNCTIADNNDTGIRYGAGAYALTNSIIWGHGISDLHDFPQDAEGRLAGVWYSCTEQGWNVGWQGCHSIDPMFADRAHYHLQSTAGHYTNGYFDGGSWTTAAYTSPLIDRGDPASDYSREPEPHGDRINMGAYGNSGVASKTPLPPGDPPEVVNRGAFAWGHRTVTLRGEVSETHGEIPEAYFLYWDIGDSFTNSWLSGLQDGEFEAVISGLTPGATYGYLVVASNRAGRGYSDPAEFMTHPAESSLYVATNGNHTAGTNWYTAYADLQTALDIAEPGDTINVAGHTFSDLPMRDKDTSLPLPYDSVFWWQDATDITIRGGYEAASGGGDNPGTNNPAQWPTVLTRSAGDGRILYLAGLSKVVFEGLTIQGGYMESGATGAGIRFDGCSEITLADCRIHDNLIRAATSYGGGLYLADSSVVMSNSLVSDNVLDRGALNANAYGGGAYVVGGSVLTVRNSRFEGNQAKGEDQNNPRYGHGGAVYVAAGGVLEARETVFVNNQAVNTHASLIRSSGGAVYNAGAMDLVNVLIADNLSRFGHSDGVFLAGGMARLVNCTIADNNDTGIRYNAGVYAVTNSIITGHANADLSGFPTDGAGFLPDVWYSNIGDGNNEGHQGCNSIDPLFADRVHYHLQSTRGHYTNGYFCGGFWTNAAADSPLIALGDPASDNSREPEPHGDQINMGAYGNTEVASMKADIEIWAPTVINHGAIEWGHSSALLLGEVTDDGGEMPDTRFRYWTDGGAVTSVVTTGLQPGEFSRRLTGLLPETTYFFQAGATNAGGMAWSMIDTFVTHPVGSFYYVAPEGDNTAGTNWVTAYIDLQTAFDIVALNDTIFLAGAVFEDTPVFGEVTVFELSQATNITIRGGYWGASGGGTEPGTNNPALWPTVLTRTSGNARVLTMTGVSNAVIERVTVRDGYIEEVSGNGAGILLAGCRHITFSDCRIHNNRLNRQYISGAGLYLSDSSVTLTNCVVSDNELRRDSVNCSAYGGGAYVDGDSVLTARNSRFSGNQAIGDDQHNPRYGRGGAVYVAAGGVLDARETVFVNNTTSRNGTKGHARGGAIYNEGTMHLINVLLAGNAAVNGDSDGVFLAGGSAAIVNCTIADNNKIGIHYATGTLAITNSIIWGHESLDLLNLAESEGVFDNFSHNLYGTAETPLDTSIDMHGANNCIQANPLFLAEGEHPYQLTRNSPAVDAGINQAWMTGTTDLYGHPRVMVGLIGGTHKVDIGAYEILPPRGSLFRFR